MDNIIKIIYYYLLILMIGSIIFLVLTPLSFKKAILVTLLIELIITIITLFLSEIL